MRWRSLSSENRAYLPAADLAQKLRDTQTPLFGVESQKSLAEKVETGMRSTGYDELSLLSIVLYLIPPSYLSPLGEVQTSLKVSGEVREIDVYFTPNPNEKITSDLGLLAQCAATATVFEPFRSSVKLAQIRSCMSKLFDLHNYLIREAKKHE